MVRMSLEPPVTVTDGGSGETEEPVAVVPTSGARVTGFAAPLISYTIQAPLVAEDRVKAVVAPSVPSHKRVATNSPRTIASSSCSDHPVRALTLGVVPAEPLLIIATNILPRAPAGRLTVCVVLAVVTAVSDGVPTTVGEGI